jgi:hypothetical protein
MSCMQCVTRGPWTYKLRIMFTRSRSGCTCWKSRCEKQRRSAWLLESFPCHVSRNHTHDDDRSWQFQDRHQAHSAALTRCVNGGPDLHLHHISDIPSSYHHSFPFFVCLHSIRPRSRKGMSILCLAKMHKVIHRMSGSKTDHVQIHIPL